MRAKLPHTTGTIDRDGIAIAYEIYGEGEHTILFLPTWAIIHSRFWKGQIPYFSDRFRAITYDPRGNGKSGRPDNANDYSWTNQAEDAIAVLDATKTEVAVLVGFSMGSALAYTVAANFVDRVSALVSICGGTDVSEADPNRYGFYDGEPGQNPQGWQKYNASYWQRNYPDFLDFFLDQVHNEPHSTKQLEDAVSWGLDGDGEMLAMTQADVGPERLIVGEEKYSLVACPNLVVVGDQDQIAPPTGSCRIAELTGGELHVYSGAGHAPQARFPAWFNTLMRDFLDRHLRSGKPVPKKRHGRAKRALYLSSPIGLGHARRDLAVARELRNFHPDLEIDWLAQDPVTQFLDAHAEHLHPASKLLANESTHIEAESGEHDLNAFQAIRNMDEILIKNFMVFQEVVEAEPYDLIIADEAWDVDHYWHEHPDLKKAPIAWFTDFVGWLPFPENGAREAYLTGDYNAEMIEHVEGHPSLRDQAIFVGQPCDIVDASFGAGLPMMRDWIPKHFEFSDYIIGQHPDQFGSRDDLRAEFGYDNGQTTCIVAVGGSSVGIKLIDRILQSYPLAKNHIPNLRMIVVTGPRLDPRKFDVPKGVEIHPFVPDLDRHLAACDLALVQGGLTTCMELAAAGTPFLYFPLRNHFEQNFHVATRLERYNAGRKMIFHDCGPEQIAAAMMSELKSPRRAKPVASHGAATAAKMLAKLI